MVEYTIRNRHRLQKKAIRKLSKKLFDNLSFDIDIIYSSIDSATIEKNEVLIIDNEILCMIIDDEPFFTIRGLLKFNPKVRYVTVDMGAVKYVSNGADVMAPGIIDADVKIKIGDLVWVRDEKNLKPLAVGRALMTGEQMIFSKSEKAISSIHYVGDSLWNIQI